MGTVRRLEVTDRHIRIAVLEMIQGDIVKALVEFVTNADDSYARLEGAGHQVSGLIEVEVEERRKEPSILRVRDHAEGFTPQDLEKNFGAMGHETSGLGRGQSVRGFFGDGLKEGVLGLKVGGRIHSIRDGIEATARLYWSESNEPLFERPESRRITAARRRVLKLSGNGTVLEVDVDPGIRLPRHDNLVRQLKLHYALRDIVKSQARRLTVHRLGTNRVSEDLVYRDPVTDPGFPPVTVEKEIAGFPGAHMRVEVFRATEPLNEGASTAQRIGGLLVQSRRALVDISFFGHENRPGTEHLFGRLVCDHIYDLLRKGDMVVSKNRTGLNRENQFVRALSQEVDRILAPIVEKEAKRLAETGFRLDDPEAKKRMESAVQELNRIMREELADPGDVDIDEGESPFRFQHRLYRLWENEERVVRLIVRLDAINEAGAADVHVEGHGLRLTGPSRIRIDPAQAENGVVFLETRIIGEVAIEDGKLRATCGGRDADAGAMVHLRVEPTDDFAFEREEVRARVGVWTDVRLRIRASLLARGREEVSFQVESGEVQVRPEADFADPPTGGASWVFLRVQVSGDRIGSEDVLIARMGTLAARTKVVVVVAREPPTDRRGGVIKEIKFNDRQDPLQRSMLHEGTLHIFVAEPSIRRYLQREEDRESPVGKALTADIVLHAFCRHVAQKKAQELNESSGMKDSFQTVTSMADQLIKKYGERVHAAWNPR